MKPAAKPQPLLVAIAVCTAAAAVQAAPNFSATYDVSAVGAALGWSSDLGPNLEDASRDFRADGSPVTHAVSATRNARTIGAHITQTAPTVLGDAYWSASWSGSIDVPGAGYYGLFAGAWADGLWNFELPGQTPAQNANTTIYYASTWTVDSPAGIHPSFTLPTGGTRPLIGSETGSFTVAAYNAIGIPGYRSGPRVNGSTFALDSNPPGHLDFTYRIAFATSPIDSSVFSPVPEPAGWALMLFGLAGLLARAGARRSPPAAP